MKKWKSLLGVLLLLVITLSGCGVPIEEHQKVEEDLSIAQAQLSQTRSELAQRNAEVQQLDGELASLRSRHNDLQSSYDELYNEYLEVLALYSSTLDEYTSALEELGQSLQPPYTAISGREITWAWKNIEGDIQYWTLAVDTYRIWIEYPEPSDMVRLECAGTVYTMRNFVPYVRTEGFSTVVPNLYRQCADEMEFAQEVFHLVTQLTVYSEDIGEVPRWPVETMTEAGGDCEDLAILFASLMKAAPYPYDLSLVYMDSDNPTDPQKPNHVIVRVKTDDWLVFAECTSDQGWDYYERVVGWYYEL